MKRLNCPVVGLLSGLVFGLSLGVVQSTVVFGREARFGFQSGLNKSLRNWGIYNTSSSDSDIQAVEAWKIQEGNRDIVVAVIDTGIDPNHKDLIKNLWHDPKGYDPKDKKTNHFGVNFVESGQDPVDVHGHGTHVAGIIGGELDPALGTSGVAHRVSIMPIKYYADSNPGVVNLNNTIESIHYAVDHGARIINYSGGGPQFSEKEYQAIKEAESKGVLFVAAAGNESENIDEQAHFYFPASYSNPFVPVYQKADLTRPGNIIVVAATNIKNELIAASNWGKLSVDVAAPGENILSTLPNGKSGYMTGTSQATAFVSGVAALILSENPRLSPQQVKEILIQTSDRVAGLENKVAAAGHINSLEALRKARQLLAPFEPIKNLAARPNPS
jgi:subtilisin family serine protease